jgi:hypothetical protein
LEQVFIYKMERHYYNLNSEHYQSPRRYAMHRKMSVGLTAVLSTCLVLAALALAEPMPKFLSYQGYLKDDAGKPAVGPKNLTFSFYSTNRPETNPVASFTYPDVPLTNGVYSMQLGPINQIGPQQYYLGVQVAGGPVLTPLHTLTIVPYAYNAAVALKVIDGAVTSTQLADSSVISAKISGPLPLSVGGTGGTSAAAARANLAVPGLATANTFITSQTITAGSANKGLVVRGSGRQMANLQEWQDGLGATMAVVSPIGNVGIGTAAPSQKLTVAGTIETTSGGVKFPDSTVQTTASTPSWHQILPEAQRFQLVMNDEAVLDRETGLVWARTPLYASRNWYNASMKCQTASIGGRMGWRDCRQLKSFTHSLIRHRPFYRCPSGIRF